MLLSSVNGYYNNKTDSGLELKYTQMDPSCKQLQETYRSKKKNLNQNPQVVIKKLSLTEKIHLQRY
jgi:hypothetical protein